jgi:hypothetical protein
MFKRASFINTPLQRGAETCAAACNRFSGLDCCREIGAILETAEAVGLIRPRLDTSLKRGVNERMADGSRGVQGRLFE